MAELKRLKKLDPQLDWSDCAILARTRENLPWVRSYCEEAEIPIRWGFAEGPALHRVREIHDFLLWLEPRKKEIGQASTLCSQLETIRAERPSNIWWQLLQDMLESYQTETSNSKLPYYYLVDWIYQYLSEQRREKTLGQGIFVNTIHAAKGLEFPHVFILGGDWGRMNAAQTEEERRILYVAMTRAEETLWLSDIRSRPNPLLIGLQAESILESSPKTQSQIGGPANNRCYTALGMKDLFLSYAGMFPVHHVIHRQLRQISTGDELQLVPHRGNLLLTAQGVRIGKLSRKAGEIWLPKLHQIEQVKVLAIVRRYAKDSQETFLDHLQVDSWEIPLVEIIHRAES